MAGPKLRFCMNGGTLRQPVPAEVPLWQAYDASGVDIGMPDSSRQYRELYVATTVCALHTSRVRIYPSVTNPVTRHPSVTAAAMLSLHELAPGRIGLGIATGDSALWSVGLKPARVAHLRDYIVAVKALLRGEEAHWQGQTFRAEWSAWTPPVEIPVFVACAGPKVLRMAAEVADGAIAALGFAPEDIDGVHTTVAEGLAASGRKAEEFEVWWTADITFAESVEEAAAQSLGWATNWLTIGTLEGKRIPESFRERIKEMNADAHVLAKSYKTPGRNRLMVERAKKLGLYDWLVSRSPRLWGTPADVSARFEELAGQGVTNWVIHGGRIEDKFAHFDILTREVMPRLA